MRRRPRAKGGKRARNRDARWVFVSKITTDAGRLDGDPAWGPSLTPKPNPLRVWGFWSRSLPFSEARRERIPAPARVRADHQRVSALRPELPAAPSGKSGRMVGIPW